MACGPNEFRQLIVQSAHAKTPRPVLFVMLTCSRAEQESTPLDALYESFQENFSLWWDGEPCSPYSFYLDLVSAYQVTRRSVKKLFYDPNQKLVVCDVLSRGRCLMPLNCIVQDTFLVPCPDDWEIKSLSVHLWFARRETYFVYFCSLEMDPPKFVGLEWRHVLTESRPCQTIRPITQRVYLAAPEIEPKQSAKRCPIDVGYVYMMIDTQERADKSLLVKIGMTGASQTPQDRLVSLRTGNPSLMLGMSTLVAYPRQIEQRVHQSIVDLADPVECQGSREFFKLKPHVTLYEMTERVLKLTFAHRLNISRLLSRDE